MGVRKDSKTVSCGNSQFLCENLKRNECSPTIIQPGIAQPLAAQEDETSVAKQPIATMTKGQECHKPPGCLPKSCLLIPVTMSVSSLGCKFCPNPEYHWAMAYLLTTLTPASPIVPGLMPGPFPPDPTDQHLHSPEIAVQESLFCLGKKDLQQALDNPWEDASSHEK